MVRPDLDALLKFDLSDLPSGYNASTLKTARLRVYLVRTTKPGDLAVHAATQDWSETTTGNAPEIAASPIATLSSEGLKSKRFIVVDATETVRGWLTDPATNFGFALIAGGATPTAKLVFASKEGPGIGPAAELEIEAASPAGENNLSGANTSIVLGGANNTISLGAEFATIPGGSSNLIGDNADFSLAAGRRANVNHPGSFVWADSTNADFSSTASNQFRIRAANGLSIANDGGDFATIPIGTYFRDNSIVAWGRVALTGVLESNFNVASITRVSAGVYTVTLNSSLQSGFSLIAAVTPEIDTTVQGMAIPPVGAANVRIAVVDKFAAGSTFNVYMYNGSFNLVDNDFDIVVTGR